MKLFTNKKLIQKITIVMVFLILFNFITPNYVRAAEDETAIETAGKVIFTPIRGFIVMLGDAFMNLLQYLFVVNEKAIMSYSDVLEQQEDTTVEPEGFFETVGDWLGKNTILGDIALGMAGGFEEIPNFKYTPKKIFEGTVKMFDINFIKSSASNSNSGNSNNLNNTDNSMDAKNIENANWYIAYKKVIDALKTDINNAIQDGDNDKMNALLQIAYTLGVTGTRNFSTTRDVSSLNYTPISAQTALKTISSKYTVTSIEKVFGFDQNSSNQYDKYGIKFINNKADVTYVGSIQGIIGIFSRENGISIEASKVSETDIDYDASAPVNALHDMIATWYKIMRNIAIVFLLSILVYVGIRIMLSSTAADSAKYKKMLIDWVVALCILFALHYIMAFVNTAVEVVTEMFTTGSVTSIDELVGSVRLKLQGESLSDQLFYTILYFVFVIYTLVFTVYYLKRVVYAAFLTLIAPLVALTYPLDRMGDGKSQAFDFWLKEYIANAIIQPVHLLIYTVLVSSVSSLAVKNPLYALVVMGAMMPAEKFIREMFGLNSKKGPGPAGGLAAGALAASAFNKILGKPPLPPHHEKDNEKIEKGTKSDEKSKIRMNNDTISGLAHTVAEQKSDINSKSTEDKDIDNGDFETSRESTETQPSTDTEELQSTPIRETSNGAEQMDEIEPPSEEEVNLKLKPPQMDEIEPPSEEEVNSKLNPGQNGEGNDEAFNNGGSDYAIGVSSSTTQDEMQKQSDAQIAAMNENSKKGRNRPMTEEEKQIELKRQKAAAKKAAAKRYYVAKNKQQLKKLGRFGKGLAKGTLKAAGAAVGVAAGATVGVAGAVATGDVNNLWKFGAAGVLAGTKGGSALGNFVYENIASGIANRVGEHNAYRKDYETDLYNHSELYREKVDAKEAKKFAKSSETKAAIKARFKHLENFNMDDAQKAFEDYSKNGIKDLNTMLNTYGLEQGIDAYGNKFAEPGDVSRDEAILAGKMAERYDVNNESARKSAKDRLGLELGNGFHENSFDEKTNDYKLSQEKSAEQGKNAAKQMMKLVDMAQGIDSSKAGLTDNLEDLKKKQDRAKAKKEYMEELVLKEQYENSKK